MTNVRTIKTRAALVLAATLALSAFAQESPEKIKKDLFAVIALQGQACAQVVDVQRRGENDYVAICKTGDRYHVYVTPDGRVNVQKQ